MKENRSNMFISLATVLAAILMCAALSFAIGKWSFGNNGYRVTVKFPNATGISPNSEVKCGGAHAGRVVAIHFLPRSQRDNDPKTGLLNTVIVDCDIDRDIDLNRDVTVTIKQDGFGIAAKYVMLTPGTDPSSPVLADNDVIQGEPPFDLSDLIQPAGEALTQAKQLVDKLAPALDKAEKLIDTMSDSLPPLVDHGNKFLVDGDAALATFNTPEGRARLNEILDSLRVSTENLKVVSSNSKALTATLAAKPWRVFWGGPTVTPPTEDQVLKSDKVIKLKPAIDVNADESAKKP
jgi:ABC-type transporter Mla subunit MlaD